MKLFGQEYSRPNLLRRVGHLSQVGGVEVLAFAEGFARGVRFVDFRTGTGFRFAPIVDRGFDVGLCEYKGIPIAWTSPNRLPGPWYYEGTGDPEAWLRVGLGGLFNTGGLVTIGNPQTVPTDQYRFTQRPSDEYGIHDRLAVTPASRMSYGEDWQDDRCVLWAGAEIREQIAYGENLTLTRRYTSELGASSFQLHDVVTNEGFFPSPHQMLYHFNVGFPVVSPSAELIASLDGEVTPMSFSEDAPASVDRYRQFSDPEPDYGHEAYVVPMAAAEDAKVSVAIVNRQLDARTGGLGVYLRYDRRQLPTYIAWRMMAEGLYVVGMEPASTPFGSRDALLEAGFPVMLAPGETRTYDLEFGILDGADAIDSFIESLPGGRSVGTGQEGR